MKIERKKLLELSKLFKFSGWRNMASNGIFTLQAKQHVGIFMWARQKMCQVEKSFE